MLNPIKDLHSFPRIPPRPRVRHKQTKNQRHAVPEAQQASPLDDGTVATSALHHLDIQRLIGDQPLELLMLFFLCPQPLGLVHLRAALLLLPAVQRLLRHAVASN